jgi:glutamyl-tRNA synthetase
VIDTIKERIRNIGDIPQLCSYYFKEPDYQSKDAIALKKKLKNGAIDYVHSPEFKKAMGDMAPFDAKVIKDWIYTSAEAKQLNPNHVMMALRYYVTGSRVGAGVAETMQVLGKETVMNRLYQE